MARRYKLQDVYDYILEYYNLEWKDFKIHDNGRVRSVRISDYRGDKLKVTAILTKGLSRSIVILQVDNENLILNGVKQSKVKWSDYLNTKHQLLTKG